MNNSEKGLYEQENLVINKDRVLTYSQLHCPLGCKYCFSEDIDLPRNKGVVYLSDKQLALLKQLPEEIRIIMLGCDIEFFQSKSKSFEILEQLSYLKKDISVVTKLYLSQDFIQQLQNINAQLQRHKNFLTISVSLTCIDSAKEWEPEAPEPIKRIETLRMAHQSDIKTLVALRPLLPTIPDEELKKVICLTKDECLGYYTGPLYVKDLNNPELNIEKALNLNIEAVQPHWMPQGNTFYKIEKEGQLDFLKNILQRYDKPLFEGAAEGIEYLRNL